MKRTPWIVAATVSLFLLGTVHQAEAAGYQMPITFAGCFNNSAVLTHFPSAAARVNGGVR